MHAFKASFLANTLLTPSFCPNELSLLEDYPALQAFSLGAPVLLSALIIPVSTPPYSTAKKRTSWGESKGEGEGAERENKKLFFPSPPLSPSITLTPTRRAAISTLPSLTNKNKPLFWEKHAQKPKLASMHFVRGCPLGARELVPGYRQKMVLCSLFEYPICDCVHGYSISPCQTPF